VPQLLRALAARPGLAVLHSAGGAPRTFSLIAFDPLPESVVGPLPTTLAGLREYVAQLTLRGIEQLPEALRAGPFVGGFVGAIAYEVGARAIVGDDPLEGAEQRVQLPPLTVPEPPVIGGLYTDFIYIEHRPTGDRAWLVLGEDVHEGEDVQQEGAQPRAEAASRPDLATRRLALEHELAAVDAPGSAPDLASPRTHGPLLRAVSAAEHMRRVESIRARIGRGDVYQVNLAQRFERAVSGHPVALYLRLCQLAPAPYMGLVRWRDGAVLSASPELLLEVDHDARGALTARTRPIKGTAPRGRDEAEDTAARAALLASQKDRAELAMIVDLERNDLARVAVPGSVRVQGFPTLETYRTVHHLVADVTATLAPGSDTFDALGSLFPGGSITGAPKRASIATIALEEGEGRGFFTGSLGCLDVRGRARFNILIRTLVHHTGAARSDAARSDAARSGPGDAPDATVGRVSFHVGGGITWRSDPAAEEHETRVKGATLSAAMAGMEQAVDTLGIHLPSNHPGWGP